MATQSTKRNKRFEVLETQKNGQSIKAKQSKAMRLTHVNIDVGL